jgi:hypothetical protein
LKTLPLQKFVPRRESIAAARTQIGHAITRRELERGDDLLERDLVRGAP